MASSCGGVKGSDEYLEYEEIEVAYLSNLEKWSEFSIENYSFDYSQSWYCNYDDERKETQVVEANEVINVNGYTMEDIFQLIANKIELQAYKLEVSYDEVYGFPLSIDFDGSRTIDDDEWCIVISNFEAGV